MRSGKALASLVTAARSKASAPTAGGWGLAGGPLGFVVNTHLPPPLHDHQRGEPPEQVLPRLHPRRHHLQPRDELRRVVRLGPVTQADALLLVADRTEP